MQIVHLPLIILSIFVGLQTVSYFKIYIFFFSSVPVYKIPKHKTSETANSETDPKVLSNVQTKLRFFSPS